MSVERLPLSQLNAMDRSAFALHLGWIYEHSAGAAERAWEDRPFSTIDDLHAAMEKVLRSATPDVQMALLLVHPDLAGHLGAASELTKASRSEQAGAGLNELTAAEVEQMVRNNAEYREKFGFPFILCARLNNAATIREAFAARLPNDRTKEIGVALEEISKIARLRLADTIS
jgi:2-oxo-4-hydroxy-4-carboxy-5-ureidoimidazoline decarboxylase